MKYILLLFIMITSVYSMQSRIINGIEVDNNNPKYKAIAALFNNSNLQCGATVIAPTWAVTAAHCVSHVNENTLSLLVNTYNYNNGTGDKIGVKRVIVHPAYDEDSSDIALLELQTAVENYMPINRNDDVQEGVISYVAGWGNTRIDGYDFPEQLQEVALPIIDISICNGANSYNNTLFNSQLCAGYMSGLNIKDSCQGDSGGPLLTQSGEDWVLSGIVSYGGSDTQSCAAPNFPGIYTKVSSFAGWIDLYVNAPQSSSSSSVSSASSSSAQSVDNSLSVEAINSLSTNVWHLVGTTGAISDMSIFSNVKAVLVYKNSQYKAYSPDASIREQLRNKGYEIIYSIDANSGMWIKK